MITPSLLWPMHSGMVSLLRASLTPCRCVYGLTFPRRIWIISLPVEEACLFYWVCDSVINEDGDNRNWVWIAFAIWEDCVEVIPLPFPSASYLNGNHQNSFCQFTDFANSYEVINCRMLGTKKELSHLIELVNLTTYVMRSWLTNMTSFLWSYFLFWSKKKK